MVIPSRRVHGACSRVESTGYSSDVCFADPSRRRFNKIHRITEFQPRFRFFLIGPYLEIRPRASPSIVASVSVYSIEGSARARFVRLRRALKRASNINHVPRNRPRNRHGSLWVARRRSQSLEGDPTRSEQAGEHTAKDHPHMGEITAHFVAFVQVPLMRRDRSPGAIAILDVVVDPVTE